jgi:hypothetical protein
MNADTRMPSFLGRRATPSSPHGGLKTPAGGHVSRTPGGHTKGGGGGHHRGRRINESGIEQTVVAFDATLKMSTSQQGMAP